jgi:RNA polymerase I-specific transcription initiation factor RRN3
MLGLDAVVWDIIGSSLLEKVVYLLTELDVCSFPFVWLGNLYYNFFFSYWLIGIMQVNITWEDILQDEHNKGIFDMELEDLAEDEDNLGQEGTKVCRI